MGLRRVGVGTRDAGVVSARSVSLNGLRRYEAGDKEGRRRNRSSERIGPASRNSRRYSGTVCAASSTMLPSCDSSIRFMIDRDSCSRALPH